MSMETRICSLRGCSKKYRTRSAVKRYCCDRHRVLANRAKQTSTHPCDDLTAPDVELNNKFLKLKTGVAA